MISVLLQFNIKSSINFSMTLLFTNIICLSPDYRVDFSVSFNHFNCFRYDFFYVGDGGLAELTHAIQSFHTSWPATHTYGLSTSFFHYLIALNQH